MARYRYVNVPLDHPLATRNRNRSGNLAVLAEHRAVLFEKIGPGPHACHWCGAALRWAPGEHVGADRLECDHLNNVGQDNRPENLVPACHACNSTRQKRIRDDEPHFAADGHRRRGVARTCDECGRQFVADPRQIAKGVGRACSKSCAMRQARRRKFWSSRGPTHHDPPVQ